MDETRDMGSRDGAAFQVIILGGGGGPSENDTTGLLVRSTSTRWTKNSVIALDAGVHLSAIEDIVRRHLPNAIRASAPTRTSGRLLPPVPALSPKSTKDAGRDKSHLKFFSPIAEARGSRAPSPSKETKKNYVLKSGPFSDLMVPYESPSAIASYLLRNLISTIVITHPHLDHLSGFTINTAALGGSRKKIIAGLPKTIEAIKTHIFNDIIWPNMSDEDGGIGFVSYNRLVEGGHPALGDEDSHGYTEICDGLEIKGRTVSHGHCMKQHKHRGSGSIEPTSPTTVRRRSSRMGSYSGPPGTSHGASQHQHSHQHQHQHNHIPAFANADLQHFHAPAPPTPFRCVIDSSAFFIRDEETGKEILMFGDVEPDAISEEPRNYLVWSDAAPKVARGALEAIFIECSYDDSQPDGMLFGHLNPRWLVKELAQLAGKVLAFTAGTPAYELQTLVTAQTPKEVVAAHLAAHVPAPMSPSKDENAYRNGNGTRSGSFTGSVRKKRRTQNGSQNVGDGNESLEDEPRRGKSNLPHLKLKASAGSAAVGRPGVQRAVSGVSPMSSPSVPVPDSYFSADGQSESSMLEEGFEAATGTLANGVVRSSIEAEAEPEEQAKVDEEKEADGAVGIDTDGGGFISDKQKRPLEGLKVVIIHVKDPLRDDYDARCVILRQCREHEAAAELGCEFYTCRRGDSVWV